MTVDLRVLGSLNLTASDGRDLTPLVRQPKRIALLAYLAVATPRGFQRRDTLLALFWPELDSAHGRAALNQALYVLRNALGEQAIVTRGDGEVGLGADVLSCDVCTFEAALDAGRSAAALAQYRGDILEGFFIPGSPGFERWLETERARLRQRAAEGAWAVAEEKATHDDAVEAARWARRAADLLPADEAGARRLMTFLHRLGDRAGAVRAYEAFAWRLNKEYELEPSAETQALALALREEGRHPAVVRIVKLPNPIPQILVSIQRRLSTRVAVLFIVATVLVVSAGFLRRAVSTPRPVLRFSHPFADLPVITGGVAGSTIALSPDGKRLVYLAATAGGGRQLFMRPLDRLDAVPVRDTRGAYLPFFSPDGTWLAFVADGAIRKAPADGGPPTVVSAVESAVFGASWGTNDVIVFATAEGLWQVAATDGSPRLFARTDTASGVSYRWPDVLPGARTALLTKVAPNGFELVTISLDNGAIAPLGLDGTSPQFVASGHLAFARLDGTLYAVRFGERSLTTVGSPEIIAEDVNVGVHGAAKLAISRAGTLAYIPVHFADRALVLVDRAGRTEMLPVPLQGYHGARFSADGRRIATDIIGRSAAKRDAWVYDASDHTLRRLTDDSSSASPVWTPDGSGMVIATSSGGREPGFAVKLISAEIDDADTAAVLLRPLHGQAPLSFTPDGRALLVQRHDPETKRDIWVASLTGERRVQPWLRTRFDEFAAVISPDGKWVAYVSNESGRDEVYVRPFPTVGPSLRISNGGGPPTWAKSGRELFYQTGDTLVAVSLAATSPMTVTRRAALFNVREFLTFPGAAAYDVHPDGERFVMIRRGPEPHDLVVVVNWFEQPRK